MKKYLHYLYVLLIMTTLFACHGGNTNQELSGLLIGNVQGLLYNNASLLSGKASTADTIDGSPVSATVIDNKNTIYAGTMAGNVWVFNNGIGIWQKLSGNESDLSVDGSPITSLAVDSKNQPYVGTEQGGVFTYYNGIWHKLPTTPYSTRITSLLISTTGKIFILNSDSAYEFSVSGNSWNVVASNFPSAGLNQMSFNKLQNKLFASSVDGNVYVTSLVGAKSWEILGNTCAESANCNSLKLISVSGNENIYVTSDYELFQFSAGTWHQLGNNPIDSTELPQNAEINALHLIGESAFVGLGGGGIYQVSLLENNWIEYYQDNEDMPITAINSNKFGNIIYGNLLGNLIISSNNAASWNTFGNKSVDNNFITSAVHLNNTIYVSTYNGIYSYNSMNKSYLKVSDESLFIDGIGKLTVAGGVLYANVNGQIWKYANQESWIALPEASVESWSLFFNYAVTDNGGIIDLVKSNNNGGEVIYLAPNASEWKVIIPSIAYDVYPVNVITNGNQVYVAYDNFDIYMYDISTNESSVICSSKFVDQMVFGIPTEAFNMSNGSLYLGYSSENNKGLLVCNNNIYAKDIYAPNEYINNIVFDTNNNAYISTSKGTIYSKKNGFSSWGILKYTNNSPITSLSYF